MPTEITTVRLSTLFRPQRVALVGASEKSTFSALTYRNLVQFGMADRTHLVNRRGGQVHGRSTTTTCADIGDDVDVAFMLVPQAGTLDALTDAAAAGIRNAVILSSGYGEAGPEGVAAQEELVAHAHSLDIVILGPNHLGFANLVDGIPVTPVPGLPAHAGRVALLSQSGASSAAMVDFASIADADLSYLVTLGNEAMITAGHVLDYLVDDDDTDAIAIFMETVRDPEIFVAAAKRAAEAGKAVVALKAGSSELSARTAAAHTGALVGDDRTIDAVFRELGVIRVDSIEDMLITAGAAAKIGRLKAPGIGIVSISGGACDIVADRAEDVGASLPSFSAETEKKLEEIMPSYGTVHNPLDITGAAIGDPTLFTRSIEIVADDPSVGVVGVINTLPWKGQGPYPQQPFVNAIGAGTANASTPVVYINQVMQPVTDYTREIMENGDVPYAIHGLRQATVALGNIAWWSTVTREMNDAVVEPVTVSVTNDRPRTGSWSEVEARELLDEVGIPVVPARVVTTAEQAAEATAELGGVVAVKVVSADILHKSDVGAVKLNVTTDRAASAYDSVIEAATRHEPLANIEGVLVSPMRSDGQELLVGVVRDPQWGLILAVALGGIFVEVMDDSALSTLPIDKVRARRLLDSLKGAALLQGARGMEPADLNVLASIVARIGALAHHLGDDLESLEVNPLRVSGSTVEALDAVITWVGSSEDVSG